MNQLYQIWLEEPGYIFCCKSTVKTQASIRPYAVSTMSKIAPPIPLITPRITFFGECRRPLLPLRIPPLIPLGAMVVVTKPVVLRSVELTDVKVFTEPSEFVVMIMAVERTVMDETRGEVVMTWIVLLAVTEGIGDTFAVLV